MHMTRWETGSLDNHKRNVAGDPDHGSKWLTLAVGALVGVAATVAVHEFAGATAAPVALDEATEIESIEQALTGRESALAGMPLTYLDWLVAHSVLDAAPERSAGSATLDQWVLEIERGAPGLSRSWDFADIPSTQERPFSACSASDWASRSTSRHPRPTGRRTSS